MKLLLLFLILVNAIFFAWSRWVDVAPAGVVVATPAPQVEALVLYEEKYPALGVEAQSVAAIESFEGEPDDIETVLIESDNVDNALPEAVGAETDSRPANMAPAPSEQSDAPPEPVEEPTAQVVETAPEPAASAVDTVAAAATQAQTVALVREDGPATTRCMTIGPFRELSVASTVASALRRSGLSPRAREEDAQVWVGHWVHLPPAGSRAAAVEVVEKLRVDGVSDIYIEGGGPMRHAISLGLFSDVSRAETRAGKIRQLGVRPQIRDRYRDGTEHWVDVDLAPGQQLDAQSFAELPDDNAAVAERPCDDYTTPPAPE